NRLSPDFVYPEGERRAAFLERVRHGTERMLSAWQRMSSAGDPGQALLVAHRGVIRAVVRQMTGTLEPHIDLGSIHILEQSPAAADLRHSQWRAVALDVTEHLARS